MWLLNGAKGMLIGNRAIILVIGLLLPVSLAACDVEVGNFGVSIGDAPSYSVAMYQGQDAIGGETVTLEQVQDKGPLVLYYFDADCEACLDGMRVLQNFYAENPEEPTVLAVYVGRLTGKGSDDDAREMLSDAGATFPAGYTSDSFVIEEHELEFFPSTSFYKSNRHYRSRVSGLLQESDLQENVAEILD